MLATDQNVTLNLPTRTIGAWGLFPGERFRYDGQAYTVTTVKGGYELADEKKPRDKRFRRMSAVSDSGRVRNFRRPLDFQFEVVWLKTDDVPRFA